MNLPQSPYYIERIHRNYRDMLTVVWMVTRECHFKCDYCYQPDIKHTPVDIDLLISKLNELPKPFRIQITGGEPLLFNWMIPFIQKIGEIGGIVELQTNFSLQVRELLDSVSPKVLEFMVISYHPVERKRVVPNGIEKFISDLHYAKSKGFNFLVWHISYPKLTPDEYLADCKVLYDAGITVTRKRYIGNFEGKGWPGDAFVAHKLKCRAGNKYFIMWENFDITPCDHDRTYLGNMLTGYKLYEESKPCQMPFCGCGGREIIVDKYYDPFFKKEFGDNDA